jgi:transposase
VLTVDHFELIRRKVLIEEKSQREVARELGHSRKTIKKALSQAAPPGYRLRKGRPKPVLDPVRPIVEAWLAADQAAPRKQRHTAQRIFERLRDEHGFTGSASNVRRFVAELKRQQGAAAEVFMPLAFAPGEEAQVDWGQAIVSLGGQERTVQVFCLKLAYSKRVFVRAYARQDLASFLDGHVRAFAWLGGVPRRLAYDNLKTAVIQVGRGRQRRLNARFLELRSWHLFESRFCNVAKGNEKGHVENLVKQCQRRFLTPVPQACSLDQINAHLERACQAELERVGRDGQSLAVLWEQERECLLPLPASPFPACVQESARIDKQSLVRFDRCWYSAPVSKAHQPCLVRGFVDRVEILCAGEVAAVHRRSDEPEQYVLDPLHYVPLLAKKPGALANARAFQGEPFGPDLALLRRELEYRQGEAGTRQFIRILQLFTRHEPAAVQAAVSQCVRRRVFDEHAIAQALRNDPQPAPTRRLDLSHRPELAAVGSGLRPASLYDALLSSESSPSESSPSAAPELANVCCFSLSLETFDERDAVVGEPPQDAAAAHDAS